MTSATAFDPARPIAIIGLGIMGTKVAWACARAGIPTRLYDADAAQIESALHTALSWSTGEEQLRLRDRLQPADHLAGALADVQLAFENVPEKLALKQSVHRDIGALLTETAWQGSNTSSLLCTPIAEASGRPDRFFCLNFNDPRTSRLVELMPGSKTSDACQTFAKAWARHIGMVPVTTRREQMGYSSNRLWREIKKEALRQIGNGYSTPEDIDRAWMLNWGTLQGPCGLMDDVGLHTILSVEQSYFEASGDESDRPPQFLVDMVERGELGTAAGKGFYTYPDPAYRAPDFLR